MNYIYFNYSNHVINCFEFRKLRISQEVYRIQTGAHELNQDTRCTVCPDKSMFQTSKVTTTRGHSKKLQIQSSKGGVRHNFFSERVTNFWNSLDQKTVDSASINCFKSNLAANLPTLMDPFIFDF